MDAVPKLHPVKLTAVGSGCHLWSSEAGLPSLCMELKGLGCGSAGSKSQEARHREGVPGRRPADALPVPH